MHNRQDKARAPKSDVADIFHGICLLGIGAIVIGAAMGYFGISPEAAKGYAAAGGIATLVGFVIGISAE